MKEKLSDPLIEYLRTDASFPSFFPNKLRGSIANLFLSVIRQDIQDPDDVVRVIAESLQKKSSYREVEKILIMTMNDALDECIDYAKNRILWEQLTPEDKKLSRTAKARETHVYLMRKELSFQRGQSRSKGSMQN